jgi:hypothetical protein
LVHRLLLSDWAQLEVYNAAVNLDYLAIIGSFAIDAERQIGGAPEQQGCPMARSVFGLTYPVSTGDEDGAAYNPIP